MPRAKAVAAEERETVTIRYAAQQYFAVSADDPKLRGIIGVGATPQLAVENLRSSVRRAYPNNKYDIIEKVVPSPLWSQS